MLLQRLPLCVMIACSGLAARAQDAAPPAAPPPLTFIAPMQRSVNPYALLRRQDVQDQLHLTVDQRNQLRGPNNDADKVRLSVHLTDQDRSDPDAARKQIQDQLDAQQADGDARLQKLLKPEQYSRLQELMLQWRGPLVLADARTAKRIGISSDRRAEIERAAADYERVRAEVMAQLTQKSEDSSPDGSRHMVRMSVNTQELDNPLSPLTRRLAASKKEAEGRILGALSVEEMAAWKTAQGNPFTFRTDIPGMRF